MHSLIEDFAADGPVLTDGAWGTQLQARGLALGECPDAWNLEHPDRVEAVAAAYVAAGSGVILTNTFGANRIALQRHGLGDRVRRINLTGVAISRSASAGTALVYGSIGPSGASVASGVTTPDALRAAFVEQTEALADGGVDGLVVETMTDLDEATVAVRAAAATGLPVVACAVFGFGRGGDLTPAGSAPEEAAERLAVAGAHVIGSNCSDVASMLRTCRRLRAATELPLWMKPNAGLPQVLDGRAVYRMTAEEFAAGALAIVDAGAAFIGGCCGTGPEHVAALAGALERREF